MSLFTEAKNSIGLMFQRVVAKINKSGFLALELARAFLSRKPKMKILFSEKSERENNIRKGFRFLYHQINFGAFTHENITAHDLIVPLSMDDLRGLEEVRDLIRDNPIPIPSLQSVNICDDKYLFSTTLMEKGFGDVIPKIGNDLPYPYVLKKKVAQSGDDCHIISDAKQKKEFEKYINHPDFFCQEAIMGIDEYATHIFFKDKKVVSSINIKYIFSSGTFVKGKDKFICTKVCTCPYLDLFASILTAIGFEGLCCFNYKMIDKKPYILEINPRFGGSLSTFFFSFIRRLETKETAKAS